MRLQPDPRSLGGRTGRTGDTGGVGWVLAVPESRSTGTRSPETNGMDDCRSWPPVPVGRLGGSLSDLVTGEIRLKVPSWWRSEPMRKQIFMLPIRFWFSVTVKWQYLNTRPIRNEKAWDFVKFRLRSGSRSGSLRLSQAYSVTYKLCDLSLELTLNLVCHHQPPPTHR